jgi:hypothetical protein
VFWFLTLNPQHAIFIWEFTLHTFLFQEAQWEAEGSFWDQHGKKKPAYGRSRIFHKDNIWEIDGELNVGEDEPMTIRNLHTLEPWKKGEGASSWQSVNPTLGLLFGMIAVVGDTILSRFVSEDGEYSGLESLRMIDTNCYDNKGALFKRDRRISSWSLELRRIEK